MDSLAIQRSLTLLEDRYRELQEIGQKHFVAWDAEITDLKQQLAAQSAQAAEARQARDQQAERVKALEAELAQQTGNLAAMAEALQRLRQLAMRPTS